GGASGTSSAAMRTASATEGGSGSGARPLAGTPSPPVGPSTQNASPHGKVEASSQAEDSGPEPPEASGSPVQAALPPQAVAPPQELSPPQVGAAGHSVPTTQGTRHEARTSSQLA